MLDRPLDPGRFVRDGKRLVVIHNDFQHVERAVRVQVRVAPPELAGAEIIRQAIPNVSPEFRPCAVIHERIGQLLRGGGLRFGPGIDDIDRIFGKESFHIVPGRIGFAEVGIEIVHHVDVVARSARVQLHVALDQGGEVLAAVAVQVVITEYHRDRRIDASVHVSGLRHDALEQDVAVFIRDGGRIVRHGQHVVRQRQRVTVVAEVDVFAAVKYGHGNVFQDDTALRNPA